MNTLKNIQTLSRIGRVLSRIVFVSTIVGFCGCVIGLVGLSLGLEPFQLGGVTIHGILPDASGQELPFLYAALSVGILFCVAEGILSRFAEMYFQHELEDGDPFTLRGAKELMRLGILTIALPLGTIILGSIGLEIAKQFFGPFESPSLDDFASVGLGVAMIIVSLLCRYGAERIEGKKDEA